jgi:hypothetical protein
MVNVNAALKFKLTYFDFDLCIDAKALKELGIPRSK